MITAILTKDVTGTDYLGDPKTLPAGEIVQLRKMFAKGFNVTPANKEKWHDFKRGCIFAPASSLQLYPQPAAPEVILSAPEGEATIAPDYWTEYEAKTARDLLVEYSRENGISPEIAKTAAKAAHALVTQLKAQNEITE